MQDLMPRTMNRVDHRTLVFLALTTAATASWAASEEDGKPASAASEISPPSAGATSETAEPAAGVAPPEAAAQSAQSPKAEPEESEARALAFPGGIRLGGMFDAVYERVGRSDDLGSGSNSFRNYHHFLFLSRQGDDVPVGFNAELLGLNFYELTARLTGKGSRVRVTAHAGKIVVPFGPDPLFHKNYGGLSGVDQRTLPVIWSAIGGGLRFASTRGRLSVSDEIYTVQGFDLPARNQTLDLQRDLNAYDGARVAVGNRLALSAGPFTLWYSFFWNPMRFGRTLIMQAVDFTVWRPGLPVLNHLALGVGAVRAHISEDETFGQPGAIADPGAYFHFADYVWLRAYLRDWIYLQVRSGLATFNNRAGLFYDAKMADASDGSHHNVALVVEHAGAQASLGYFWNFEKVDERPDDLFRLMVTYAF
jgi:hypothetical protein